MTNHRNGNHSLAPNVSHLLLLLLLLLRGRRNQSIMTGQGGRCCAGLITLKENSQPTRCSSTISFCDEPEVSNSEQLLSDACAIMALETSTSSLSFRFSELSQLSEILSS